MEIIETQIGIVDGLETIEVKDAATGEVIGYNQTAPIMED
jgi:hypothetical protein